MQAYINISLIIKSQSKIKIKKNCQYKISTHIVHKNMCNSMEKLKHAINVYQKIEEVEIAEFSFAH